jgi:serine/threonine-protein kinase HipA
MNELHRLEVRLGSVGDERVVGQLAEDGSRVFFEYDPEFLRRPLWLSPFKLPPRPGLIEHRDREFGPIFGLFGDSLPDGWGLLLMDRFFRARAGRGLAAVSPLEKLAYLGRRTMGALTYHPPAEPSATDSALLDLNALAAAAAEVLSGSAAEVLPALLRAGGSPGGARPKVVVGVHGDEVISGEAELRPGFSPFLIKFPAREDNEESGRVELAYAELARRAGITLPATRLFGDRYFGVERFDRRDGRPIHVHSFGNLIHADFRVSSSDYRQLLEVTRILTKKRHDVLEAFRRMVFNVAAHNRDDHVKNFAFLMSAAGEWSLAPAYDLTFSEGPGGEHSLTVAGAGRNPTRRHLLEVARAAGLESAAVEPIIEEVVAAVADWPIVAGGLDIDRRTISEIGRSLQLQLL